MRTALLFIILLSAYTTNAQSNSFKLTDSTVVKNAIYTCPMLDFYNGCNNKFNKIQIDSIKNFLRINKSIKIQIACHTDQRGSSEYNKLLSEKYAMRLKELLIDSTITDNRITTIGYGESKPIVDIKIIDSYKTDKEKQIAYERNRRIEIIITDL
ncbi:OmpA family protein [Cytophaga aurantiaca]|uniref:OmpA family protein n=1 Tax=Cytophaga aurantiaca TaxID=29530 RepID=UPI0003750E26|nr:OmpA family protein [Cytophaga aurantiaca]